MLYCIALIVCRILTLVIAISVTFGSCSLPSFHSIINPHFISNRCLRSNCRTDCSFSTIILHPPYQCKQVAVSFGNCNCPAPFLILLRKGGCALLIHFLTPLNSKCSGAAYTQATAPKERLAVLLPAMFQQQTQPLTLTFSLPPYTARSAARFLRRRCRSRSAVCRP